MHVCGYGYRTGTYIKGNKSVFNVVSMLINPDITILLILPPLWIIQS